MQILVSLIDDAVKMCGSQAELARRLEITPQFLSAIKKGKAVCPADLAGEIAIVAGKEIAPAVLDAVMDALPRTARGQRVKEAMQKAFLAGAAAMFATSATPAVGKTLTETSIQGLTVYASYVLGMLRRLLGTSPATKNQSFQRSNLAVLTICASRSNP